jgi:hypothetical protein
MWGISWLAGHTIILKNSAPLKTKSNPHPGNSCKLYIYSMLGHPSIISSYTKYKWLYNCFQFMKSEVLLVANMKMSIFWDVVLLGLTHTDLITPLMEAASPSEMSVNIYQAT